MFRIVQPMVALRLAMPPCRYSFSTRGGRYAARSLITLLLLFCLGQLIGCGGHASVHMVSTGYQKISMTKPLIEHVEPDACYFWVNDKEKLCVAMHRRRRSLLGALFEREFALSLVLSAQPSDTAKRYRADRRTLRLRADAGMSHTRAASLGGIVALARDGPNRLRGRFRIPVNRQSYSVLTGWGKDTRVLLVGEFLAVHNPEKGKRLFALTEEGMLARDKLPAPPGRRRPTPREPKKTPGTPDAG